jgi:hypothetical protein
MRRIKPRICAVTIGFPRSAPPVPGPNKGTLAGAKAVTVSGLTISRHLRQPDRNRDIRTLNTGSEGLREAVPLLGAQLKGRARSSACRGGAGAATGAKKATKTWRRVGAHE